jgi:hypothetical protein
MEDLPPSSGYENGKRGKMNLEQVVEAHRIVEAAIFPRKLPLRRR